jgi:hypothetical protein
MDAEPISLLAWMILTAAASLYPVGFMLGSPCSKCCSGRCLRFVRTTDPDADDRIERGSAPDHFYSPQNRWTLPIKGFSIKVPNLTEVRTDGSGYPHQLVEEVDGVLTIPPWEVELPDYATEPTRGEVLFFSSTDPAVVAAFLDGTGPLTGRNTVTDDEWTVTVNPPTAWCGQRLFDRMGAALALEIIPPTIGYEVTFGGCGVDRVEPTVNAYDGTGGPTAPPPVPIIITLQEISSHGEKFWEVASAEIDSEDEYTIGSPIRFSTPSFPTDPTVGDVVDLSAGTGEGRPEDGWGRLGPDKTVVIFRPGKFYAIESTTPDSLTASFPLVALDSTSQSFAVNFAGQSHYVGNYQACGLTTADQGINFTRLVNVEQFFCGDMLWAVENGPCRTYASFGTGESASLSGGTATNSAQSGTPCAPLWGFGDFFTDECPPDTATATLDDDIRYWYPPEYYPSYPTAWNLVDVIPRPTLATLPAGTYALTAMRGGAAHHCFSQTYSAEVDIPFADESYGVFSGFIILRRERVTRCGPWMEQLFVTGQVVEPFGRVLSANPDDAWYMQGINYTAVPKSYSVTYGTPPSPITLSAVADPDTVPAEGGDVTLSVDPPGGDVVVSVTANASRFARQVAVSSFLMGSMGSPILGYFFPHRVLISQDGDPNGSDEK